MPAGRASPKPLVCRRAPFVRMSGYRGLVVVMAMNLDRRITGPASDKGRSGPAPPGTHPSAGQLGLAAEAAAANWLFFIVNRIDWILPLAPGSAAEAGATNVSSSVCSIRSCPRSSLHQLHLNPSFCSLLLRTSNLVCGNRAGRKPARWFELRACARPETPGAPQPQPPLASRPCSSFQELRT